MAEQGTIADVAALISAVGGLAWPGIAVVVLYLARNRLLELLHALIDRIKSSSELKFGSVELKGVLVTTSGEVIKGTDQSLDTIAASPADLSARSAEYDRLRRLMLVHTVRPVRPKQVVKEQEVFDVSIYLYSHGGRGKLNDVKSVSYFLGDSFGKSQHGYKWSVSSANQQFAMSVQAYGSFLCMADLEFQDGSVARCFRYIDTEMLPAYADRPN